MRCGTTMVCKLRNSFIWRGNQARDSLVPLQDVEGQGVAGDVIEVRHGLARNKLIPNKWAVPATRPNIERFGRRVQVCPPPLSPCSAVGS